MTCASSHNTLIIYISGDNGTSPEGSTVGTPNQYTTYNGPLDIPIAEQMKAYDAWGSAGPIRTWRWHGLWRSTLRSMDKQVASHFGGTRQGMVIAWPNRIKDAGGIRTQFHHFIDIMPTILEATGFPAPVMVNGIAQKPIEGVSMAYTSTRRMPTQPSTQKTQYFEMYGDRAIYHDGWIAATTPPGPPWLLGRQKCPRIVNGYKWELYNIKETTQSTTISRRRCPTSFARCRSPS